MLFREAAEERMADDGPVIQLLAFHPLAAFGEDDTEFSNGGVQPEDPADYALRSPHPIVHLLRDSDVLDAETLWAARHATDDTAADPPSIQARNAAYLRGLGAEEAARLLRDAVDTKS